MDKGACRRREDRGVIAYETGLAIGRLCARIEWLRIQLSILQGEQSQMSPQASDLVVEVMRGGPMIRKGMADVVQASIEQALCQLDELGVERPASMRKVA